VPSPWVECFQGASTSANASERRVSRAIYEHTGPRLTVKDAGYRTMHRWCQDSQAYPRTPVVFNLRSNAFETTPTSNSHSRNVGPQIPGSGTEPKAPVSPRLQHHSPRERPPPGQ
jgi:hypothetical protein